MSTMLLGRRLLAPLKVANPSKDAQRQQIALNDRFFCETMELIPAQYYFPTDEEENWLRSAPKMAKKYHKGVKAAALTQETSRKSIKRAKYTPAEQKTNEERQIEAAEEEKAEKQQAKPTKEKPLKPMKPNKDPTRANMEGLKERLAVKIQTMREQRKADEKAGKKRKENGAAKIEPAPKKRKTGNNNKGVKKDEQSNDTADAETPSQNAGAAGAKDTPPEVSAASISYGSLLLDDEDSKKPVKKTRNGQGIRGIKNLLKKAERNQQRMEELKKTEEGKALVQAKGWEKAIKQAGGEVVLDDPKLLRNKLKKKEKSKAKSAKEWKARLQTKDQAQKEKIQKKLEPPVRGKKKDDGEKKTTRKGAAGGKPRAGFEGKKGSKFLNANQKKK